MKQIILFILTVIEFSLYSQVATMPDGSGTTEDPYQIASFENLYWITLDVSRRYYNYIQISDINASITYKMYPDSTGNYLGWNCNNTYFPSEYNGNYDGQGYTIDSLYINRPTEDGVGLFTGGVTNLGLTNVNITGRDYTGSVGGNSSNCFVTGIIRGNNYVGGIGSTAGWGISRCFSNATVIGNSKVGGICGYSSNWIENCYSNGIISGTSNVGGISGICGDDIDDWSWVEYCYSSAKVSGDSNVGGLIGDSYQLMLTSCYWDIEASGISTSAGGAGKTTEQMKDISTYAGWDFASIWNIDPSINEGYPFLRWQNLSGIEIVENLLNSSKLYHNYPNPFNPATTISYALSQAAQVELSVYNLKGQLVQSLVNGKIDKGVHTTEFNGTNLTTGMYIYNLKVDDKIVQSRKMMLLK